MEEAEIGEVGTDKVAEGAHEKARGESDRVPWLRYLALSTAIFAVLAAIASLRSGQLANESLLAMNEATLKQAQASDQWSYYQAKGIKQTTREAEYDLLSSAPNSAGAATKSQGEAARYQTEQEEIKKKAEDLERERQALQQRSSADLERHHTFAYCVTTLQVAIGLSAIAALIELRLVWYLALLAGLLGILLFIMGVLATAH